MLAALASNPPTRRGGGRQPAATPLPVEVRAALRRVARARWARLGLAGGVVWMVGWFALGLPFAYGVPMRPVSERLAEGMALLRGPLCLLIVWGSGALAWHGRRGSERIPSNAGALSGAVLAAHILALSCLVVAALGLAGLAAAILQMAAGATAPNWGLYASAVVSVGWGLCLWAGIAVSLQALVGERRLGTMVVALAMLGEAALPWLGPLRLLCEFGPGPMPHSHLNGYGHQLAAFIAAGAHGSAFTALFALGAWAAAPRTAGERLARRCVRAARRLAPRSAAVVPLAMLWLGSGAWLCSELAAASAERLPVAPNVGQSEGGDAAPNQPALLGMDLQVEIHPRERRVEAAGTLLLGNLGATRIRDFAVSVPPPVRMRGLDVPAREVAPGGMGLRRFVFDSPLRPVERIKVTFDLAWRDTRFPAGGGAAAWGLASNGTFLTARMLMPRIGRADAGAGGATTPAPAKAHFKIRLGTTLDQVAVAPGELKRSWKENDRSYFEYEGESPAVPSHTIHSGRYAVVREPWRNVSLEVFHAPAHALNVPAILQAVRESLAACTAALGPYPLANFRVVETRHAHSGPAIAGVAAYGERFAFTADLRSRSAAAPVFAAIERDVARQWGAASGCAPHGLGRRPQGAASGSPARG